MRLKRITLRGLLCYRSGEPVHVDFEALGSGLVAVTGQNGAGKSTLIEAVPAALYKVLPSRDSWYEYWHARDAFAEVVFDDEGDEVKVRIQVDAEARRTERYLFVNGLSATAGRAKEADAEILRRFGSYELFLASILGSQTRAGNFLDSVKGERKARFAELLGLGRYQRMSEDARDRAAKAAAALDQARERVRAVEIEVAGLPLAEDDAQRTQAEADKAAHALEATRTEEASATSALERARTAQERLATLEAGNLRAGRAREDAAGVLQEASLLGAKADQAAAQRRAINRRDDPAKAEEEANAKHLSACKRIDLERERIEKVLRERPELEAARARVEELDVEECRLREAQEILAKATSDRDVKAAALAGAEARRRDEEERVERERLRLEQQTAVLGRVPCAREPHWRATPFSVVDLAGTCPLLAAARDARDAGTPVAGLTSLAAVLGARKNLATAEESITEAAVGSDAIRLAEISAELPRLRAQAARLPAVDEARRALTAMSEDRERADKERSDALQKAHEDRERIRATDGQIDRDLAVARSDASRKLADARTRLQEAMEEEKAARDRLATAREEIGALTIPQAEASRSGARQARIDADRALREADRALTVASTRLDQLRARVADLDGLQAAADTAAQEVGDWRFHEQAWGRDGIQALEIAAAGPEVSALTNALLESCWGTRWTVAFETLREKRSAPGEFSEAFDVLCFDRGAPRTVEGISGGERVVIGESVALAIAIYNARKSGIRWATLFRDETSGALSLANASNYADMMRRALALGGFHQIVFISHQPEVIERADARLVVADGRITVEGARRPEPTPAGAAA